ncbi:MAG: PAS domain S-box protein [Haloplanus sp.]
MASSDGAGSDPHRRLQTLFDTSPDAIILHDTEGTIIDVNNRTVDSLGFTREELRSMNVADIEVAYSREELQALWRGMDTDEQETVEGTHRREDGSTFPVEVSIRRIDLDGEECFLTLSRDITERKERERRLKRQTAFLEHSASIVAALDETGTIEYQSPATERVLGYDSDELVGETAFDYVHPDDRERVLRTFENGIANPDPERVVEYRFRNADGEWRWLRSIGTNCLDDSSLGCIIVNSTDITERKEREQELERYERLVENLPIGVYRCTAGADGEFRLLNDAMVEMFDADSKAQLREHTVSDLYRDPSTREAFSERLANEEILKEAEIELETLDGAELWGSVTAIAREVEGDTVFDGAIQDITERKEFEQRLSALHGATREFVDAASKTEVAETAIETANELLGFSLPSVWFPTEDGTELALVANSQEHQALLEEAGTPEPVHPRGDWFWDVFESGETVVRNPIPRDDLAADVPLQSVILLPLGEHGVLTCAAEGAVDFTDREISITELLARNVQVALDQLDQQEALKRQTEFTDDLLDALDDIVYVLDSTGGLRRWNEAFEAVTRYTGEELDSMHIGDFFAPDDAETVIQAVDEAFESGDTRVELELVTKRGESIPYEFIANTFDDPNGEPVLAGIGRDRTVHVEYEQRLKEQRDNLEILNQVVRHDIRNDLQMVSAYAELIDEHTDTEQEYVETVIESAEHAVELTKTAREMAEVMLTPENEHRDVCLRHVLEKEIDDVRTAHPEAAISVDGSIPNVTVIANDMLGSVFRNLLKNAIQHNDKEVPNVIVSARIRDDEVVVQVADNGPGVPDERKDAIFGQGESGLESAGTGLGLYLVRMLIDAYGGDVWVEDNDPEGAVFVVALQTATRDETTDR